MRIRVLENDDAKELSNNRICYGHMGSQIGGQTVKLSGIFLNNK